MPEIAIRVENLSKRYRIGMKQEMHETLGGAMIDLLTRPVRNFSRLRKLSQFSQNGHDPEDVIWALKDVSFEVQAGEVMGIIGPNGAGKSTLLKILSRITEPTAGRLTVGGRAASLLEVGTGFHPEMTGRENVYLYGTVLGMSRAEINRKFDEIVSFAEVAKFIDTPIKRYSTGMGVRLAFAVAAHLEPEILMVDEVLAVGDADFQRKCLGKMGDVARGGRTVLLVSHNMNAIVNLCNRVLWIDRGVVKNIGPSQEVVSQYLSYNSDSQKFVNFTGEGRHSGPDATVTKAAIEPSSDDSLTNGMELAVTFTVQFHKRCQCSFFFNVWREGVLAFACGNYHQPVFTEFFEAGQEIGVTLHIPKYLLNPGYHSFGFAVTDKGGNARTLAYVPDALPQMIDDDQFRRGGQYFSGWGGAASPILPITARTTSE